MRSIPTALLVAAFALPVAAQAPEKVTAVEGITEYRLQSGLRVLLFPDRSRPLVTVNLTVFVGSRHEGYGETGMAHLLEHMLFKGTPTFADVPKSLRDHGARFNGTTWTDRTNYYETMPASDENLEFGIRLEADRLIHSLIRREDLVSEMTVVRNEFEMGENDSRQILSQRMAAVAFEWHNYGKSTIGNRSDIERVPIENLQAFYRKFYQPDNALLIVAGEFDSAKALALVAKHFGPIPKPKRQLPTTYTEEPAQDGERTVVLRVGTVGAVGAAYHIPAGSHPDFAAVEVLADVLTIEPAGRLYKALVEAKIANTISGGAFGWHDPGLLEVGATCDPAKLDAARDTLVATLERLSEHPVTAEEVLRAKRHLFARRDQLVADSAQLAVDLSDWAAKGDWRLFFLHRDRLEKVTPDDANRIAARYLTRSNRTVGVFVPTDKPQRAEVPATGSVAAMVQGYAGRKDVATGEAFDPTPANIDARTVRFDIGAIKAAFLPRKTRGETVTARLVLRYGTEESLKGRSTAADLLPEMLRRGTLKRSRQQVQDEFAKLTAKVSIIGEPSVVTASVTVKREHLLKALALLTEVLREPAFPEAEFEALKTEMRDELEQARTEPSALAFRELQRRTNPYPPDDIRYMPTIDEELRQIKGVTLAQVKELYAEQLSAQAGELAVVGDFDPAEAKKAFATMFGGWTAKVPYRRVPRPARPELPGGKTDLITPDKANAVWVAGLSFASGDKGDDYPALEVGNFLLGGDGGLSNRLGERVRQKEGLSYSVESMTHASSRDAATRFIVYAITNPANVAKVETAITEELVRFLKDGPTPTEVREGAKAYLKAKAVERSEDSNIALELATDLSVGRTMAYRAQVEERVAALTPERVAAAFRKWIDPKKLIVVRAGDFAKK